MTVRLAVFDCDGTLVDSRHSIIAAMATAFETHGLPPADPRAVSRVIGLPLAPAIAMLLPEAGAADPDTVAETYRGAFAGLRRAGRVREPLYPGALEALEALEAGGWLLGVATGKSRRGLMATLEGVALADRFANLQTADLARGKPDPDMLLRAMAETGAGASSTVMIGDTVFDMEMAVNAGVMAIGVAWGYHEPDRLQASGARSIIDSFADLPDALELLMEAEK